MKFSVNKIDDSYGVFEDIGNETHELIVRCNKFSNAFLIKEILNADDNEIEMAHYFDVRRIIK